jgi:hypothetical protein
MPGGKSRESERRKRVVAKLDRHKTVESGFFGGQGERCHIAPMPHRQGGIDPHYRRSTPAIATRAMIKTIKNEIPKVLCHHSCQMP